MINRNHTSFQQAFDSNRNINLTGSQQKKDIGSTRRLNNHVQSNLKPLKEIPYDSSKNQSPDFSYDKQSLQKIKQQSCSPQNIENSFYQSYQIRNEKQQTFGNSLNKTQPVIFTNAVFQGNGQKNTKNEENSFNILQKKFDSNFLTQRNSPLYTPNKNKLEEFYGVTNKITTNTQNTLNMSTTQDRSTVNSNNNILYDNISAISPINSRDQSPNQSDIMIKNINSKVQELSEEVKRLLSINETLIKEKKQLQTKYSQVEQESSSQISLNYQLQEEVQKLQNQYDQLVKKDLIILQNTEQKLQQKEHIQHDQDQKIHLQLNNQIEDLKNQLSEYQNKYNLLQNQNNSKQKSYKQQQENKINYGDNLVEKINSNSDVEEYLEDDESDGGMFLFEQKKEQELLKDDTEFTDIQPKESDSNSEEYQMMLKENQELKQKIKILQLKIEYDDQQGDQKVQNQIIHQVEEQIKQNYSNKLEKINQMIFNLENENKKLQDLNSNLQNDIIKKELNQIENQVPDEILETLFDENDSISEDTSPCSNYERRKQKKTILNAMSQQERQELQLRHLKNQNQKLEKELNDWKRQYWNLEKQVMGNQQGFPEFRDSQKSQKADNTNIHHYEFDQIHQNKNQKQQNDDITQKVNIVINEEEEPNISQQELNNADNQNIIQPPIQQEEQKRDSVYNYQNGQIPRKNSSQIDLNPIKKFQKASQAQLNIQLSMTEVNQGIVIPSLESCRSHNSDENKNQKVIIKRAESHYYTLKNSDKGQQSQIMQKFPQNEDYTVQEKEEEESQQQVKQTELIGQKQSDYKFTNKQLLEFIKNNKVGSPKSKNTNSNSSKAYQFLLSGQQNPDSMNQYTPYNANTNIQNNKSDSYQSMYTTPQKNQQEKYQESHIRTPVFYHRGKVDNQINQSQINKPNIISPSTVRYQTENTQESSNSPILQPQTEQLFNQYFQKTKVQTREESTFKQQPLYPITSKKVEVGKQNIVQHGSPYKSIQNKSKDDSKYFISPKYSPIKRYFAQNTNEGTQNSLDEENSNVRSSSNNNNYGNISYGNIMSSQNYSINNPLASKQSSLNNIHNITTQDTDRYKYNLKLESQNNAGFISARGNYSKKNNNNTFDQFLKNSNEQSYKKY